MTNAQYVWLALTAGGEVAGAFLTKYQLESWAAEHGGQATLWRVTTWKFPQEILPVDPTTLKVVR